MKINEFLKPNNDFYEKCMVFLRFSLVFHCFSTQNQYTSQAKPRLLPNPLIFFCFRVSLLGIHWQSLSLSECSYPLATLITYAEEVIQCICWLLRVLRSVGEAQDDSQHPMENPVESHWSCLCPGE